MQAGDWHHQHVVEVMEQELRFRTREARLVKQEQVRTENETLIAAKRGGIFS